MSQSAIALTLGNITVRQHNGLFSLNDLHKAAGGEEKHQPAFFVRREETQALIAEIKSADSQICMESRRGNNGGTYACRELVIAYAAWISAAFHLKVIRVFLAVAAPQATPYTVQPSDTLTEPQQIALRALLESNVKRLPHDKQAGAMVKGWSKLKAHFGVPYRQIPASEFTEAISIVARHIAEWELVDETKAERAVNELVADWVKKIEEPNGYPAFLFLPLVEAVQRKTARTTGMLPEAQAREITVRLERLCRLFHPFSDQAGDVIGVLRALRGLHPNSSAHTPGYLQLLPRL